MLILKVKLICALSFWSSEFNLEAVTYSKNRTQLIQLSQKMWNNKNYFGDHCFVKETNINNYEEKPSKIISWEKDKWVWRNPKFIKEEN